MEKRTPEQMEKDKAKIVAALSKIGSGRAEEICKATKFTIIRFRLPIRKLLAEKLVEIVGDGVKRAQTYGLRSKRAPRAAKKKRARAR